MTSKPRQHTYDHRLVRFVQETGDATIATGIGVPRSTVPGWLGRAPQVVTAAPGLDTSAAALRVRVARLEKRVARLMAVRLAAAKRDARRRRLEVNRAAQCAVCA